MRLVFLYFNLALMLFSLQSLQCQYQGTIDSLRNSLAKSQSEEDTANINLALYKSLRRMHSDSAQLHLEKAIELNQGALSDSLSARIYVSQIEQLLIANDYDRVFNYVNKALKLKGHLNPKLLVDVYSMQGTAHYYKSEYAKAIQAHREAEKVCVANKMETGMAKVFNNIGIAYIKMEDWPKAKEYMGKSFELCKAFNIERGMAFTLGNLGIINKNQGDFKAAIEAYQQSNKLLDKLKDERGMARNFDNIGALYKKLGNQSLAEHNFQKSLQTSRRIGDESTMASALHNLGGLYAEQGKLNASVDNYEKSLAISEKLNNKDVIRDNHLGLAQVYEGYGSPKLALQHQKLYGSWKDSITSQDHLKSISELEIKYETKKKENDILLLSQEKLRSDAQIDKQETRIRQLSYLLIGAIVILGIGSVLVLQYLKNRRQKELIETIAETQIAERHRIARDLHDSVGGSLAMATNKLQFVNDNLDEDNKNIQDSIQVLVQTADQVRQISHNLMPGELVKFGLVTAIHATLDQLEKSSLDAHLYAFNMEDRIDPTKEIHVFRIVQEAIQNVIKHAQASKLSIYLNKHKKHLSLMVEDDGMGMGNNKNTSGIGLNNIESRVSQLKGSLNIDSGIGRGTTISIQIPT
ncbi:tetratricopeptide repeat-containing sensor histidine kinase [Flagellimonas sp.]|uniref:tetratricopeptide repeat-containing sensor histidine kinase n=1 Tax=Flagellimonas sp. TaxID=2058762 RepID=UPI003F49ED99